MRRRVLFIDAYDSFSNNIISLLETKLDVEVTQIKIDSRIPELASYLQSYFAVVAGPGPGNPAKFADVGLIRDLWTLPEEHLLPVLGICLGFQSLVLTFGGSVSPLDQPRHGIVTRISASPRGIFKGIRELLAVQYHSLHGCLGHQVTAPAGNSEQAQHLWQPRYHSSPLIPLAWEFDHPFESHAENDEQRNPRCILMAVKHVQKPFYGIQFHPESICSEPRAATVIQNWWDLVEEWHTQAAANRSYGACNRTSVESPTTSECTKSLALELGAMSPYMRRSTSSPTPLSSSHSNPSPASSVSSAIPEPGPFGPVFTSHSVKLENLTVPKICQLLGLCQGEVIVLDSEMRQMSDLGTHSIIGLIDSDTIKLNYKVGDQHVDITWGEHSVADSLRGATVFTYLKRFMNRHKLFSAEEPARPFIGGLMGYVNYEACLETIHVPVHSKQSNRPDLCFAYVERSILIDHAKTQVHVQSIKRDDTDWIYDTVGSLNASSPKEFMLSSDPAMAHVEGLMWNITPPLETSYKAKIRDCQSHIRAGDSYELCLTNQATVKAGSGNSQSSWPLYLRLRHLNPAPFSAYVRIGPLTLLSTSPERFMSWSQPASDPSDENAFTVRCQFRPIKGTVKKHQVDDNGDPHTVKMEEAIELLSTTKERAENLMIVDLIRHDLHGVVGSGNVNVQALMVVEEYETVYQLVSVIEGTLKTAAPWKYIPSRDLPLSIPYRDSSTSADGIDVLAASLPPGSMTGAPKRRSCELLQSIENHEPRSIYSGVLGYMSAGGGGDFSVVIRSVFKWDQDSDSDVDEWKIGAGGAVTGLSTENGEWDEMMVKMKSTLGLFTETKS